MKEKLENIPCVILCGGKSSRMGQDKCFLPYKNKNLVTYQYHKFLQNFKKVYISTKKDKFNDEFPLILDEGMEFFSPMLALFSVLKNFHKTYVFVLSIDMPRFSFKEVQILYQQVKDEKIILAQSLKHKHFLCGFYHSDLAPLCLEFLQQNTHKISLLSQKVKTSFIFFDDEKTFTNLNCYDDYLLWKNDEE